MSRQKASNPSPARCSIGVTGGIASGKSTASRSLVDLLDAQHIDTDRCAADLLVRDPEVKAEVLEKVSSDAYKATGELDRNLLRKLAFEDEVVRRKLEAILHPRIRAQWTYALGKTEKPFFVVEIPLLYETAAESCFDVIVVAACARSTQTQRLTTNRGLPESIAQRMIDAQLDINNKVERADHVLWTEGPLTLLNSQVAMLAGYLRSKYD